MDGKNSKFDFEVFYDEYEGEKLFAVNRDKYTAEESEKIFMREMERPVKELVMEAAVRFGAGRLEDGEKYVGWWLDFDAAGSEKRRCPVRVYR